MVKVETIGANHIIIIDEGDRTLFSYDTPIATIMSNGNVVLYKDWAYSATTSKFRSEFLREKTADTRKKLLDHTYTIERAYA